MNTSERFLQIHEYMAAGMFEECDRSLFYRKALGIRRYYENCPLYDYNGEYLYPSGIQKNDAKIVPHYLTGTTYTQSDLSEIDKELLKEFEDDFYRYSSSVPKEHCVAGNMYTHSSANYKRIAAEGLDSYEERIKKISDKDMREGLLHLIAGIRVFHKRSLEFLSECGARAGLIDALNQVPFKPARSLYEAIVSRNFVMYLDNCDNLGAITVDLFPYYKGENVVEVLKNLYDNLDCNGGYSMSLDTNYSPLTVQCLEAATGKRRPMIELFVNENMPTEVWNAALKLVKSGGGQPAFYSEQPIYEGLMKKFPEITKTDIKSFCGGGCTESMLEGLCNVGSLDAGINLALIFRDAIFDCLEISSDFEVFYRSFIEKTRAVVDTVTTEISNSEKSRSIHSPLPMRTLLTDDCIDKELDFNAGGARYTWSIINFAGMINLIDGMLVIRDTVFKDKIYTPSEFCRLLADNDPDFLSAAKSHPVHFGIANPDADAFAHKISSEIYAMLEGKKTFLGGKFIPASIQFMTAASAGKAIGATPDGRADFSPLCDSLGAIFGKDTKGPTALLRSVTALDLKSALGIPVLNFNIDQSFDNATLRALIEGYVRLGGIQMQISCVSKEELLAAYENPEDHRNLIVRVGGYSEYFCRLNDELKMVVINRTIQESERI